MTTAYLALTSALVLTCAWGAVAGLRRAARRIDDQQQPLLAGATDDALPRHPRHP